MAIGYAQQLAMIRFHMGKDPKTFDEMASYWCSFKWLVETNQIPMPNVPLEFK